MQPSCSRDCNASSPSWRRRGGRVMHSWKHSGPCVCADAERVRTVHCDVLIGGAGPAGAIAGRQLALAGLSVVMADRLTPRPPKIGETLPGAAIRLLKAIGLEGLVTEQP